jgi:dephospho-CoA kinase
VAIIDCDKLARVVVEPGRPALQQIVAKFGPEILLEDGTLNRLLLGDIIFANPDSRRTLTAITGKYITIEILKNIVRYRFQGYRHILLDAPILFESKSLAFFCCPIIVVHVAERDEWLSRLQARDSID